MCNWVRVNCCIPLVTAFPCTDLQMGPPSTVIKYNNKITSCVCVCACVRAVGRACVCTHNLHKFFSYSFQRENSAKKLVGVCWKLRTANATIKPQKRRRQFRLSLYMEIEFVLIFFYKKNLVGKRRHSYLKPSKHFVLLMLFSLNGTNNEPLFFI